MPGLTQDNQVLTQNAEYDELVGDAPGLAPFTANEEPDPAEMEHFHTLYADFMEELMGPQERNAVQMLTSAPDLYQGVSKVAYNVLSAVHQRAEQRDGPVPPAALFGEGAMIHTAVDEVFQMAIANKVPGSESQDQYTAAQMDMSRLVGEFLQGAQEDGAIDEAQEMLLESEGEGVPEDVTAEERMTLEQASSQPIDTPVADAAQEQGTPVPIEQAGPQGGLV